jgi:peptide/nickel transport system ATP-binding protein
MTDPRPILELRDLVRVMGTGPDATRAVDGVSLVLHPGQTLGLVGESGCGKSTLARCVAGLLEPTAGTVLLDGQPVAGMGAGARRARARVVQMIFQDPFGALNPRLTVARIVEEPLTVHRIGDAAARRARVADLLDRVGLSAAQGGRFPHELSGGQRQRVAIARALALEPRLIVCDEAVSALDVSIQAQVLNLLADLQAQLGLAYLFISHDLSVIRHVSDRIAVMYLGRIVETGTSDAVWTAPRHPYTRALVAAIPGAGGLDAARRLVRQPEGGAAGGCRFRPRCPAAVARCAVEEPGLMAVSGGQSVACWVGVKDPA